MKTVRSVWSWLKSSRTWPLRLYVLALILRILPVLATANMGIGLDDMFQYDMLARSLVAGNGYRWYAREDLPLIQPYIHLDLSTGLYDPRGVSTSFRPPLYPAFLAIIYLFAGVGAIRFFIARLVQVFVGAALVPLTYAISRRLFPDREPAARMAAWVVTLYPMLVIYPLSLATENLFFVLILSSTLSLLRSLENRKTSWFVLSGILLGLTALTRSVSLLFSGLAVLWIWFVLRDRRMALLVFLCVTTVTLPWMLRNTLLHHRLTGIESALGYDLYVGYHPLGSGTFQYPQSLDLMPMLDDGLRDQVGREKTWEFIQADPGRVPYLFVRRAGYFFGLERRALTYFYSNDFFGYIPLPLLSMIAGIILLPFILISISAALGLATTLWNSRTLLLGLFLIGYITPHLIIIAEDRFHLTIVPFLAILAAQSWVGGWGMIRARWMTPLGKPALILAAISVVLLFSNWGVELWRDAGKIVQLLGPNGNQTYFPY